MPTTIDATRDEIFQRCERFLFGDGLQSPRSALGQAQCRQAVAVHNC